MNTFNFTTLRHFYSAKMQLIVAIQTTLRTLSQKHHRLCHQYCNLGGNILRNSLHKHSILTLKKNWNVSIVLLLASSSWLLAKETKSLFTKTHFYFIVHRIDDKLKKLQKTLYQSQFGVVLACWSWKSLNGIVKASNFSYEYDMNMNFCEVT